MSPHPQCDLLGEGHREAMGTASASCSTLPAGTLDRNHRAWPGIELGFQGPQQTVFPTGTDVTPFHAGPQTSSSSHVSLARASHGRTPLSKARESHGGAWLARRLPIQARFRPHPGPVSTRIDSTRGPPRAESLTQRVRVGTAGARGPPTTDGAPHRGPCAPRRRALLSDGLSPPQQGSPPREEWAGVRWLAGEATLQAHASRPAQPRAWEGPAAWGPCEPAGGHLNSPVGWGPGTPLGVTLGNSPTPQPCSTPRNDRRRGLWASVHLPGPPEPGGRTVGRPHGSRAQG